MERTSPGSVPHRDLNPEQLQLNWVQTGGDSLPQQDPKHKTHQAQIAFGCFYFEREKVLLSEELYFYFGHLHVPSLVRRSADWF